MLDGFIVLQSLSLSLLKFIVLHALELNERVNVTATKIITVIISGTTSLLRIANRLVMDSYCRGGILRTRRGCTHARHEECSFPKALWQPRVRISSNPSGHIWPHACTHPCNIFYIYVPQGIRVYGDDHLKLPMWQYYCPMALSLLGVSISGTRDDHFRQH